jgi:hypothetical protein
MSVSLTAGAIQQFDDEVKQAYQAEGSTLRKTVRVKSGVVGNQHRFPTLSRGIATPRVPQTDVVPMGVTHARVTATLSDWNAAEYTDVFDQQKNNVDERQALAAVIANAIGRREDQLIIAVWDAATPTGVSNDVGGTDTNLNTAKFRAAKQAHDRAGVPKTDRYAAIHANNLFGLLGDSDATTFDKNAVKALVDGEINKWLGYMVMSLEDRDEGGLTLATNDRSTYFYHGGARGCTGLAVGIDFRTEVNYVPEKTSWLSNGLFSAGACVIEVAGLVEVICREA